MARLTRYERATRIIYYLRHAEPTDRSIDKIARQLDMPYSSVRLAIKEHYPHCFDEKKGVGWFLTGAQPEAEIPFDFNAAPPSPSHTAPIATVPPENATERPGKWTWNQEALRYLDLLWQGKTFTEVLTQAQQAGNLKQLVVLGKTMARAAEQMDKTGKVPYVD